MAHDLILYDPRFQKSKRRRVLVCNKYTDKIKESSVTCAASRAPSLDLPLATLVYPAIGSDELKRSAAADQIQLAERSRKINVLESTTMRQEKSEPSVPDGRRLAETLRCCMAFYLLHRCSESPPSSDSISYN